MSQTMKKQRIRRKGILTILIVFICFVSYANQEAKDTTYYNTYQGKVVDSEDKSPLVFANITLKGTNVATVSNSEGDFIIKVLKSLQADKLEFSYLGYKSVVVSLSDLSPKVM